MTDLVAGMLLNACAGSSKCTIIFTQPFQGVPPFLACLREKAVFHKRDDFIEETYDK